eukprot:TRINITY_DN96119_c0_g1_i1.p1 TRINITY_DN96119_c0_g1~~TRINITY_DN96119_c0_g1_i1.p1  ORF type:complete len:173 (+),score=13.79 TRINITY_DN96119_c0_g1_i1:50-568(+)
MGAHCTHATPVQEWEPDGTGRLVASRDVLAHVQKQIHDCLWWSGGFQFESGKAQLKESSQSTCASIAEILKRHPAVAVHVVCYTEELPKAQSLAISTGRAGAVISALVQLGCRNLMVPEGKGFVDNHGARVELTPLHIGEAERLASALGVSLSEFPSMFRSDGRSCDACPQQ